MPPLIDVYLFCGAIGSIYIIGSALLGFIDTGDSSSGDGDATGADSGDAGGIDSSDGGDAGGIDSSDGGDAGGIDASDGGDAGGIDASGGSDAQQMMRANLGQYGMQRRTKRRRVNFGLLFLKLISPSTITAFMAFFGMGGYLILHYLPFLGIATLIPAIICGVAGYKLMTTLFNAIASKMYSSGSYSSEQIIGRIAEVSVPIPAKGMGELTYTFGSTRETAPARSYDGVKTFPTGSKVVVADLRDGIYFVEEFSDDTDEIMQLEGR